MKVSVQTCYKVIRKRSVFIQIELLREYYFNHQVYISEHADRRFRERGIKARDVRNCVMNGRIIEDYPDDFPFPSCLILGKDLNGNALHVVMSSEGSMGRIITAYKPDPKKWSKDFSIRKENF